MTDKNPNATGTKPPRGAVRIVLDERLDGRHRFIAVCKACGWTYTNTVRSDVEQHKRWHLCP